MSATTCIRAIRGEPTDAQVLEILEALLGKYSVNDDDGTPGALYDCYCAIENQLAADAREDQTPDDSWVKRQDRAMEKQA